MFIETTVAIAITGVAVKALDLLYTYVKSKTGGKTTEQRLEEIWAVLSAKDSENMNLIYFPRRIVAQHDEYNQLLRNLTHNSESVARTLDKLTTTLEVIVRVVDKIEDRTNHLKG